jgi:hypothetical protein
MPATRSQYLPTPGTPGSSRPPLAPAPATRNLCPADRARRLRHQYRHDPRRLQQSLRQLATEIDGSRSDPGRLVGRARLFAIEVAREIEGRTMRYSARCRLLQLADELGIGRFEANLIIASVQHTTTQMQSVVHRPRRFRWIWPAALAALVQAAITWAVWILVF